MNDFLWKEEATALHLIAQNECLRTSPSASRQYLQKGTQQ